MENRKIMWFIKDPTHRRKRFPFSLFSLFSFLFSALSAISAVTSPSLVFVAGDFLPHAVERQVRVDDITFLQPLDDLCVHAVV